MLFPGARYLPLRRKCIEWLNLLSRSSGVFIPVTSLVLDALEYKMGKESVKPGKDFKYLSAVKVRNICFQISLLIYYFIL